MARLASRGRRWDTHFVHIDRLLNITGCASSDKRASKTILHHTDGFLSQEPGSCET